MKDSGTKQKTGPEIRKPLQESSNQNIEPTPTSTASTIKGFKSAMHIEQVSNNHFIFTEENKPPDSMMESLDPMEETKEEDSSNAVVLMQDDKVFGVGNNSKHQHAG